MTVSRAEGPLLSVVVPVWNRAALVRRCLDSVLAQAFHDYELIAVDDGSTDGSLDVIAGVLDPRLRVVARGENGGTWAARTAGVREARGAWIMFLDSDDELKPGALAFFSEKAGAAPPAVGVLGGSYRDRDGNVWPDPPPPEGTMGLERFLAWADSLVRADFLAVYRREVFDTVHAPQGFAIGTLFDLEIFGRWEKLVFSEICGTVGTDAPNRQTGRGATFSTENFLRRAEACAAAEEEVLRRYGEALRRHAPRRMLATRARAGIYALAAGHRYRGAAHLARYLARRPASPGAWAFLVAGLIGPQALAAMRRALG